MDLSAMARQGLELGLTLEMGNSGGEAAHRRGRGYTRASLRREKLWILRTEKIIGLPCSILLRMVAPLNFEESNCSMPRDSVLLTQNLHWMLQIRQVGIDSCGIVNNDMHGPLQKLL
jgi:hypothetical protein